MAKSSRASSRKANNQRLKAHVFGPVEAARAERLSAKLLELAAQPKPSVAPEAEMKIADEEEEDVEEAAAAEKGQGADDEKSGADEAAAAMDVDEKPAPSKRTTAKGRVQKRRKAGSNKVVFRLYKDNKKSSSKRKR